MNSYAEVSVKSGREQIAEWRNMRLKKTTTIRTFNYVIDLMYSLAIPLVSGIAISVTVTATIFTFSGSATWVKDNVYSEQVLSALATMLAFIVSSRLNANLNKNSAIVGHFGNLSGICLNLAIWSRSLVTKSGNLNTEELLDGFGGKYNATEMGLLLASIPYIVKYTNRNVTIRYEELPLGSKRTILDRITRLTQPENERTAVSGFTACIMLLGEQIDGWDAKGHIQGAELATMFAQLSALTNEEGAIGGLVSYSPPGVMTLLLYLSFFAYYFLLILSDLGPNNGWSSVWIVAVLIVSNFGIYTLSGRYANPFMIRTGNSTQKALVAQTCRDTEMAIASVYNTPRRVETITGTALSAGFALGRL